MLTITPAYGRDYKSKKDVMIDYNNNKDFVVNNMFNKWDGKPINKSDIENSKLKVMIRYNKLMKICVIK